LFLFFLSINFIGAVEFTFTEINDTFATISISSAVNLYSYEVNLDYNESIESVVFHGFLASDGADTSNGYTTRDDILSAYESRLDNTRGGISGSGDLFNVSFIGNLSLRSVLLIDSDGDGEVLYYNGSEDEDLGNVVGSGGSGGGGGGGGGGGVSFNLNPSLLNISLGQGEKSRESFEITNPLGVEKEFNLEIENLEDLISLSQMNVLIPGLESREVNVDFEANADPGVYTGKINVESDSLIKSVNVLFEILEKDLLYNIRTTLVKDELGFDEQIEANIILLNLGIDSKSVTLEYMIKDFEGNEFVLNEEELELSGRAELERSFDIPEVSEGEYVFIVKLTDENGKTASGTSTFRIVELLFSPQNENLLVWIFSAVIALGILILIIVKLRKH